MAFIRRTLLELTDRYAGEPATRESVEVAMSRELGMPVKLSDYNPKTQAYETVEVSLPHPVQYIELNIELGEESE